MYNNNRDIFLNIWNCVLWIPHVCVCVCECLKVKWVKRLSRLDSGFRESFVNIVNIIFYLFWTSRPAVFHHNKEIKIGNDARPNSVRNIRVIYKAVTNLKHFNMVIQMRIRPDSPHMHLETYKIELYRDSKQLFNNLQESKVQ